ncbi:MAG TPA: NADH-quinone oxidoreductase subunit D [Anaerolineae bacterium]|nr:NADH-quinone oxidoreductase subunit D [Anaerolineae bacterium]HPL27948.1 NADH-quinone oxidoreductase subunit D [Anaerolineae bacterium]
MLRTETLSINMGPQHPSTHGVFRMVLTLDGERVVDLVPHFGYLHRGIEKLAEGRTYLQNVPFTDRLDYISGMSNNLAYALAVEKLAGMGPMPERAEYLRVIMAELTRLANHCVAIGFLLNDLGAFFTPVLYCLRQREYIVDLFEMASGSRMTPSYIRPGGVAGDVPPEFLPAVRKLLAQMPSFIDQLDQLLTGNEILMARMQGVGVLPPERAVALGVTGPLLRASGVPYDVRTAEPYSVYGQLDFDVVTEQGQDAYARYLVRIGEMRQSVRILEQALARLPEGPVMAEGVKRIRPPAGEAYARIEAPKGELGFYLVSDGTPNPYRYHIRATSLANLGALRDMCIGHLVADVVIILGSIDITLGEVDR